MSAVSARALAVVLAEGWIVTVTTAVCQATLARLWFRHRVEVIRDEAVTAVLDGVVPWTGQLAGWLAELEAITSCARRGDLEFAAAALASPAAGHGQAVSWPGLDPAGRDLLVALAGRAWAAATACLTWSRPAAVLWPVRPGPGTGQRKTTASDPCQRGHCLGAGRRPP